MTISPLAQDYTEGAEVSADTLYKLAATFQQNETLVEIYGELRRIRESQSGEIENLTERLTEAIYNATAMMG